MKRNIDLYTSLLLIISLLMSCEVKNLKDIEQDIPVVVWESEEYRANVVLQPLEEKVDDVLVRLFGTKLDADLSVEIEVDPSTTAIEGVEFSIETTQLTIEKGMSHVKVPFVIDSERLEADVEKQVVLNIKTVGAGARNAKTQTTIKLNKILYDVSIWAGDYTFVGDGWTRSASVRATGTPYELVMNSFWGNGIDMLGMVDATDMNNLRFVVPAGTKLDNGWDSQGQWWLKNDLIATLDEDGMIMDFIQFDFVCDDGTEGSFPWCSETCQMVKN
jgi:hypothetical protein